MRKKRMASFAVWLVLIFMFAAVSFFNSGIFGVVCIFICCLILGVSTGINLYSRKYLRAKLVLPVTASKNKSIEGKLRIKYNGIFPINMYASVKLQNRLTNEESLIWLQLSAARGRINEEIFELCFSHCGYVVAELKELLLIDWFGFISIKAPIAATAKMSVLPDTFPMSVTTELSLAPANDSEMWSDYKKGEDYSEIFALKEYAQGDSVKQIHWKLSSKIGRPVVKEASFPIEESLLLFWDKNNEQTAEMTDALAEIVTTVARELAAQGVQYTLAWSEDKTVVFEDIDSEESLIRLIPGMIKTGPRPDVRTIADDGMKLPEARSFGKAICFAARIDSDFIPICQGENILVTGNIPQMEIGFKTIIFTEDTYMEDLQAVEL